MKSRRNNARHENNPAARGLSLKRGFVITTADERRSVGKAIEILPWRAVARGEMDIG